MSIDSSLFGVDIPAGTYNVGDVIPLKNIDGPANVRSGRGAAILKTIVVGNLRGTAPFWRIHVKNSDWIDEVVSISTNAYNATAFDDESGLIQKGHDCNLTPNSGWQIYAECIGGGTSTVADSIFCLIDIDYPQAGGVTNPRNAAGLPTSIPFDVANFTLAAIGNIETTGWMSQNVDYFKAGYKYVLDAVEIISPSTTFTGFIAFSNAAGMGGLTRIIPINSLPAGIRYSIKYSSILQKGPMDVKMKLFAATAGTSAIVTCHDYVKQKV